jgi:hypothetical protein
MILVVEDLVEDFHIWDQVEDFMVAVEAVTDKIINRRVYAC